MKENSMSTSVFHGTSILLGVTGGIACYKAAYLASRLRQLGALVDTVMTPAATQFVAPLTFQTLTGRSVYRDIQGPIELKPEHIALAERPRLTIVAPLTANTLAKLANGFADNLLTATLLACSVPLFLAPAMNSGMWQNPATQHNLALIRERPNVTIIDPKAGNLACGEIGMGRMAEPDEILSVLETTLLNNV